MTCSSAPKGPEITDLPRVPALAKCWTSQRMAATLLEFAGGYALIGLCTAAIFLVRGIDQADPNARGAWAFRPLLIPGLVLIWPLVLWRWWRLARGENLARRHRPPRSAQDHLALALALLVPLILATALLARQDGPHERPAVMIAPPDADAGKRP